MSTLVKCVRVTAIVFTSVAHSEICIQSF